MSVELEMVCKFFPQSGVARGTVLVPDKEPLLAYEQPIPGQREIVVVIVRFERSKVETPLYNSTEVAVEMWMPSVASSTKFMLECTSRSWSKPAFLNA